MNKSLKFEYLCRKFWFLGFEKGLEIPQDPIYSWFQSGKTHAETFYAFVLCLFLVLPGLRNRGDIHRGTFLKVCVRKYYFALGLCKIIEHFLVESLTLWSMSFLTQLKWPVTASNFQNGWKFMGPVPQLCTVRRSPIFVTGLYPYPVLVASEETKYSARGKGVQPAETLGFGLYNLILI